MTTSDSTPRSAYELEPGEPEPPPLVQVPCGVDEYGQPTYRIVPPDTAGQWDDREWRNSPL